MQWVLGGILLTFLFLQQFLFSIFIKMMSVGAACRIVLKPFEHIHKEIKSKVRSEKN